MWPGAATAAAGVAADAVAAVAAAVAAVAVAHQLSCFSVVGGYAYYPLT